LVVAPLVALLAATPFVALPFTTTPFALRFADGVSTGTASIGVDCFAIALSLLLRIFKQQSSTRLLWFALFIRNTDGFRIQWNLFQCDSYKGRSGMERKFCGRIASVAFLPAISD